MMDDELERQIKTTNMLLRERVAVVLFGLLVSVVSPAQLTQLDSLKADVNQRYAVLVPQMKEALSKGNIMGTLQIARQIDAMARPVFGVNSYAMANVWHAIYSPIYTNLRNYRMVYLVNDSARRALKALGDTAHPHYLGSLNELAKVCFLLNPPLTEEGFEYGQQAAAITTAVTDPLGRVRGHLSMAEIALKAAELTTCRKQLLLANSLLDTLKPYTNVKGDIITDSANILVASIQYAFILANYLTHTGQLAEALAVNEEALATGPKLAALERSLLYNLMNQRAAIFSVIGQYDSAVAWARRVLERSELLFITDITQTANMMLGLASAGKQAVSGASTIGSFTLVSGSSWQDDLTSALVLRGITLFDKLIKGDTASWQNEWGTLKAESEKQKHAFKISAPFLTWLQLLFEERRTAGGLDLGLITEAIAKRLLDIQDQLPFMSEAEQRQAFSFMSYLMDLPYARVDSNTSPQLLAKLFALHWQRKGVVLRQWQGFLQKQSRDTTLEALTLDWKQSKAAFIRSISLGFSKKIADSLYGRVTILEATLGERLPRQVLPADSLIKLMVALPKGAAIVDFVRVQFKSTSSSDSIVYKAFILNGNTGKLKLVDLCSEQELLKLFSVSSGQPLSALQLVQRLYTQGQASAARAYQLLWQPLAIHLSGVELIYLSKAGVLHQVAFGALLRGNKRLIQSYSFREAVSLPALLAAGNEQKRVQEAQVWGGFDYGIIPSASTTATGRAIAKRLRPAGQMLAADDEPIAPLDEGAVAKLAATLRKRGVQVQVYSGKGATEGLFKTRAEEAEGLLHINTHGFYAPPQAGRRLVGNALAKDPMLNIALAMSGANYYWMQGKLPLGEEEDGLLTAYELAGLNLSRVQLAALSACETALGEPTGEEGTLGLVRSLKMAGVQKVLASLWPVPAKATNELMLAYYTHWYALSSPAAALRKTQLEMLQKGYPPFYWAGWVLVE
jgi:CHAT domain-containing protein